MSLAAWAGGLSSALEWFAKEQAEEAVLVAAYENIIEKHFVSTVTKHFWDLLQRPAEFDDNQTEEQWCLEKVPIAFEYLHEATTAALNLVSRLPASKSTIVLQDKLHRLCRQVVSSRPHEIRRTLRVFFRSQFSGHMLRLDPPPLEEGEEENQQSGPPEDDGSFGKFCMIIHELKIVDLTEEVFSDVLVGAISTKISDTCADVFNEPRLEIIRDWLNAVVFPWLRIVITGETAYSDAEAPPSSGTSALFAGWKSRLEFLAFETLANLRINELFDIIVDYPDSSTALDDLKECLQRTKQFGEVVAALRSAFQKRLLHPGAQTSQILRIYIATIKAIRQLDPSSLLLEHASPELRAYLRQRSDTLRCIVSALTAAVSSSAAQEGEEAEADPAADAGDQILIEELQNNDQEVQLSNPDDLAAANEIADDSEDEDGQDESGVPHFMRWTPKTSNNPASLVDAAEAASHRSTDILSLLLGIYGSKDVFVKEYTAMLAEKLFAITDFNTERQVRNVELLKLKFGETSLSNCEIMLKDMADSKRINAYIAEKISKTSTTLDEEQYGNEENRHDFPLTATIVSYLFWPEKFKSAPATGSGSASTIAGPDTSLGAATFPKVVREQMKFISSEYTKLKASRKLEWQDHLGQVELQLEFPESGETKEFTCTPQQASVILLFDSGRELTIDEIIGELTLPAGPSSETAVKKRLAFWIQQGIVKELEDQPNKFRTIQSLAEISSEESGAGPDGGAGGHRAGGLGGAAGDDQADEEEEEGIAIPPFVMGMLTNLGTCTLDKIHMMLSMLVPDYSKTPQQTAAVLNKMVTAEQIECTAGEYSLKK